MVRGFLLLGTRRRYRPTAMAQIPKMELPTSADVDAAAKRLAGVALHTPLVTSPVLDALTGARVFADHALNVRAIEPEAEVVEFVAEDPHFAA